MKPAPARPRAAVTKRKVIPAPSLARASRLPAKRNQKKPAAGKSHLPELLTRLQLLRQVTRETAMAYLTKIDLDLSSIVKRLTQDGKGSKQHPLKSGTTKQMLKLAKKMDLKPAKGRRKDLRKIEKAVEVIKWRMTKK